MASAYEIKKDTYYDSVTLMLTSSDLEEMEGVEEAIVGMGTDYNLDSLQRLDLYREEFDELTPHDLIFCVRAEDEETAQRAIRKAQDLLTEKKSSGGSQSEYTPPTQSSAADMLPEANMVIISVPGEYAAKEAHEALDNNRHVMLFSDNVSLQEELELKEKAVEKGLLMMGPDCGTAIINNKPLAFANSVRSGNIGVVAASGTGLQEVTSIIHQVGGGISQGIGVGGRDLSEKIEGRMTLLSARVLDKDDDTDVILLISKPPAKSILDDLLEELKSLQKPTAIFFIGADPDEIEKEGFTAASNLEEAALKTCRLAGKEVEKPLVGEEEIKEKASGVKMSGDYVRGLYSGGTLCDEAQLLLVDELTEIYSNTPVEGCRQLDDLYESQKHTIIDLGEDEFTRGRAHPMIDPKLRQERIVQEFEDEQTGLIMLDIVLGYGSHPDMAGAMLEASEEGRQKTDRELPVLVSLCGTDADPQNYSEQKQKLQDAGVYVFPSNVSMVRFAQQCLRKEG